MSLAIWIDKNINSPENKVYTKILSSFEFLKSVALFKDVEEAIVYIKHIKFDDTKIIVSGRLYPQLIKKINENISEMYVIPKIIVFTSDRVGFIVYNKDYEKEKNRFYNFGGIATTFQQIKEFLFSEKKNIKKISDLGNQETPTGLNPLDIQIRNSLINESNEDKFLFEYIDKKEQLILPLFFKNLIDYTSNNSTENFTSSIYDKYANNYDSIKELLGPIKSISKIPVKILSKYYARLYSTSSDFNKDLNQNLSINKTDDYLPFIKVLYEGIKLKALPLVQEYKLYRASRISSDDIIKLKNYMNKKINNNNLPTSIMFTKTFLSFSKYKNIEDDFLNKYSNNNDNNLFNILYILENDNNPDYNLATYCDIEKISFNPNKREVLFFPFSSFEIKDIKELNIKNQKQYEITLSYLGKYLKDIENDKYC